LADDADFVIVGGGMAGLVLARRLVLAGKRVVVLEASQRLGGTVARQTVGGIDLDAGAESFATRGGTVAKLVQSLQLGGDIVEPNPEGAWLQTASGGAFPLPKNSLLGIPGSPLAEDVTAIIGTRAGSRAFLEAMLPSQYGSRAKTLGELVRKRMGSVVLDELVRPIARGVQSTDPDDLPLDAVPGLRNALMNEGSLARAVLALRTTSARAGSAVAGIRGGVVRIVDALASDLERFGVDVRLGARVTDVQPEAATVGGITVSGRVIVAAPGVLDGSADRGSRVTLATLVVDQPLLDEAPRGTGVLVADGAAGVRTRALTHSTAKWAWLAEAAGGRHVLRLSYDGRESGLAEIARSDSSVLLGVPIERSAVLDFASVEWYRPKRQEPTPDGIPLVGESIAGTGLASVVARSEAFAGSLLTDAGG
jgi:oxygen-dependent protoporphyrinogen oxidase